MYCEECGEKYTIYNKWCKLCQIDKLKKNFANWTSGNEKIDNFIQEMQLKINSYKDIIVEWIPYNQFDNIIEIGTTLQTAIWKDGPLYYCPYKKEYKRKLGNKKVALKCLNNLQDIILIKV